MRTTSERPLDDGARLGPERWRDIGDVSFCHWDRSLLRLALDELDGLASMERAFRQRAHAEDRGGSAADALCAQLVDLGARLTLAGLTPDMLLDEVERASEWLWRKAHKRVWQDGPHRTTEAMRRTPRRLMQRRALRGNWETGEGSPEPHVSRLWSCVDDGYYDEDGTALVLRMMDTEMEVLLVMAPGGPQRRGIRRALLTVLLEAIERFDDGYGPAAALFREHQHAWMGDILKAGAPRHLLRDLLELLIWDGYGLADGVEDFLRGLPDGPALAAASELARLVGELEREGLRHELARARRLQTAVLFT